MKNKYHSKILRWLLDVFPKGIAVFAIAAGAFYVYAQSVTFPGVDPYIVTGVVGQFVGVSAENYTSSVGYEEANAFCRGGAGALAGSHICTAMEIINSYNIGNSAIDAQAGDAWINNGPPAHDATLANDCDGWKGRANNQYGSLWKFGVEDRGLLMFCNQDYPFACCK